MSPNPALLFDLDGTLVDTAPDLTSAANHVLEKAGLRGLDEAEIRKSTGQGGLAMLRAGLKLLNAEPTLTAEALLPDFLAYYGDHIADKSRVFEGLMPLIEEAKAAGVKMAVVTNKTEEMARKLISALKLDAYFPVIVGGDTLATRKPEPEMVFKAMKDLVVEKAIMIGDSYADRGAAEKAGIPFIGVGFGYGPFDVSVDDLQWFADQPQDLRFVVEAVAKSF